MDKRDQEIYRKWELPDSWSLPAVSVAVAQKFRQDRNWWCKKAVLFGVAFRPLGKRMRWRSSRKSLSTRVWATVQKLHLKGGVVLGGAWVDVVSVKVKRISSVLEVSVPFSTALVMWFMCSSSVYVRRKSKAQFGFQKAMQRLEKALQRFFYWGAGNRITFVGAELILFMLSSAYGNQTRQSLLMFTSTVDCITRAPSDVDGVVNCALKALDVWVPADSFKRFRLHKQNHKVSTTSTAELHIFMPVL